MLGMIFNRFAERSLLSALIGSSPARSSPRVLAPSDGSPGRCLVPRAPVPGRWKFLANSDFLTMDFVVDESSWRTRKLHKKDFLVNAEKAGSEKLGMTLKEAVTRLGRFSHPEVLILR